jgi:rifampicin phosphotransferase
LFFGAKLKFRPLSDTHKTNIQGTPRLPIVDSDELFKGIKYQPLTEGEAYGKLRILRKKDDEVTFLDTIDAATVLLCEVIPTDLPAVRPLELHSHVPNLTPPVSPV